MKLNLGSGNNKMGDGWTNLDKYHPEATYCNLNSFPWRTGHVDRGELPTIIQDNSVDEIMANHILEHLDSVCDVMREIYRVCKHGAKVQINVPSPTHMNYWGDPTHKSPVTPLMMTLFSKENCRQWKAVGAANSPLADYFNVDFRLDHVEHVLDQGYADYKDDPTIGKMINMYWNVVCEYRMTLTVLKEEAN